MATFADSAPTIAPLTTTPPRVAAIDILRGLTMMVMIFVNELDGVRNLPWWNHHAPADINFMTYVDMVFPLFLFIVGLSLPLAIDQRLRKDPSISALWKHILQRSLALIVMGLILANAENVDPALTHLSGPAWTLIALTGAVLFWLVYSRDSQYAKLFRALRLIGLAMMIAMFAIFRRTTAAGATAWIDLSYPEILGLIGFSYLSVCILYIPTRRVLWAPLAWFAALITFCVLTIATGHLLTDPSYLYIWPFGNGAMPAMVMAGVVVSTIFREQHRWPKVRQKMWVSLGFAAACLAAGGLLTPLGISKIRATPTWCLYSIAAGTAIFAALYWLCDVKGRTRWAFFVRSAGSNTLLTYLLPDLYFFLLQLFGVTWFATHWNSGAPGAIRTAIFTACMLALSAVLTRMKIRLQL
jgi:predicted acyltransferase